MYRLIQIIENSSNLAIIANNFSNYMEKNYSKDDIVLLINSHIKPLGILKGQNQQDSKIADRKPFLTFKLPLLYPELTSAVTNVLQYLFEQKALIFIAIFSFITQIVSISCISLDSILNGLQKSSIDFLFVNIVVIVSVIFHEFGHISACRRFGGNYEEIGFGLYLFFPVFYAKIDDIWRLDKKSRIIIDLGGIYFQYIFNIMILLLYLLTGEKFLIYSFVVIFFQTLTSLNPFLKYDGYWLATDLLGVPNLRKHSSSMLSDFIKSFFKTQKKDEIKKETKNSSNKLFVIYAILSNLIFFYFIGFFFKRIPVVFRKLHHYSIDIINMTTKGNPDETLTFDYIYGYLFLLLQVAFVIYFIYRLYKIIKSFITKAYSYKHNYY